MFSDGIQALQVTPEAQLETSRTPVHLPSAREGLGRLHALKPWVMAAMQTVTEEEAGENILRAGRLPLLLVAGRRVTAPACRGSPHPGSGQMRTGIVSVHTWHIQHCPPLCGVSSTSVFTTQTRTQEEASVSFSSPELRKVKCL